MIWLFAAVVLALTVYIPGFRRLAEREAKLF